MTGATKSLRLTMLVMTCTIVSSTHADLRSLAATYSKSSIRGSRKLRGAQPIKRPRGQNRRFALKGGGGHHHSSYMGCLDLSDEELAGNWKFSGEAPDCTYVHTGSSGGDGEDESDGGDGGDAYDNGDGDGDEGNDNDNGDADGDGDGEGDGDGGDDEEVVVSNEDITNGGDYDPFDDFILAQCDTYKNLWMWDLSLSCEDEYSLDTCNCTFAEELLELGVLDCDDAERCPEDCPICSTCLTLLGCEIPPQLRGPSIRTSYLLYIIAGVVVALILGLAIYHSRRARQDHELSKNLMAGESGKDGFEPRGSHLQWQPPAVSPLQFEPSNTAAAVAGGIIFKHNQDEDSDCESSLAGTAPTLDETTVHMADTIADDATAKTLQTAEESSENQIVEAVAEETSVPFDEASVTAEESAENNKAFTKEGSQPNKSALTHPSLVDSDDIDAKWEMLSAKLLNAEASEPIKSSPAAEVSESNEPTTSAGESEPSEPATTERESEPKDSVETEGEHETSEPTTD